MNLLRVSIFVTVCGLGILLGYSLYLDSIEVPVFITVTVDDKLPEYSEFGGGDILGTDGIPYTITDFTTMTNDLNKIRESQGLQRIPRQFYWNKAFQINDTYLCNFRVAPSGSYCLSNCTKISGGAP